MTATRTEMWAELHRATAGLFGDGKFSEAASSDFTAHLCHVSQEEGRILSVCSEDFDNMFDEELEARWEIYLHEDGHWTIE